MGFTTPAFIRRNTPELRKKLEELGYNHPTDVIEDESFCIATSPANCNYHIIIKGAFDDTNPHYTWNCAGRMIAEITRIFSCLSLHSGMIQTSTNGLRKGINGLCVRKSSSLLIGLTMTFTRLP